MPASLGRTSNETQKDQGDGLLAAKRHKTRKDEGWYVRFLRFIAANRWTEPRGRALTRSQPSLPGT